MFLVPNRWLHSVQSKLSVSHRSCLVFHHRLRRFDQGILGIYHLDLLFHPHPNLQYNGSSSSLLPHLFHNNLVDRKQPHMLPGCCVFHSPHNLESLL